MLFAAEGSWTCGGGVSVRGDASACPAAAPAAVAASQPTPAFRAIIPSFVSPIVLSSIGVKTINYTSILQSVR